MSKKTKATANTPGAAELRTLADLKPAPLNPRAVTPEALAALRRSLGEFGDISGLVWNARSGHLVAGHQRMTALRAAHGAGLTLEAGAVVTPTGERFPVRVVDWDDATEKAANLAANSPLLAGEFTPEAFALAHEVELAMPDLATELRLDELFPVEPENTVEELREVAIHPLPEMAWVLVGVPLVRYPELAGFVEQVRAIPDVTLEMTVGADG